MSWAKAARPTAVTVTASAYGYSKALLSVLAAWLRW
jgi:hypothetical protein